MNDTKNPFPVSRRVRSHWFVLSGAAGGLLGFLLMEGTQNQIGFGFGRLFIIWVAGVYFAGFALAVGAALGATEGVVRHELRRAAYGLTTGAILGVAGGFVGGLVGQIIYLPAPSQGLFHYLARVQGWAAIGLLIGAGQGVRENTREDVVACALGGLVGGTLGGMLFDPLSSVFDSATGAAGRLVGDVVVGACIGGAMRLLQERLVDESEKPATTLTTWLPKNPGLTLMDD